VFNKKKLLHIVQTSSKEETKSTYYSRCPRCRLHKTLLISTKLKGLCETIAAKPKTKTQISKNLLRNRKPPVRLAERRPSQIQIPLSPPLPISSSSPPQIASPRPRRRPGEEPLPPPRSPSRSRRRCCSAMNNFHVYEAIGRGKHSVNPPRPTSSASSPASDPAGPGSNARDF
jgi:hypothetical protein